MNTTFRKTFSVASIAVISALVGGVFFIQQVFAATGSIYISPSTASVQNGSSLSVNVRINPGTATDTVTISLGFDSTKLHYSSIDYAGSPYNTQVGFSSTSNSVSFAATNLSGTQISTDSFVARITFTAAAGSGTTSLSLAGSNAASAGTPTNPSLTGATITLTSPPATCPAGQTGTPPNCTTPPSTGGSGSGGSSNSSGGTKPPTTGGSSNTNTGSSAGTGGSTTTTTPKLNPAKVTDQKIQYTAASVSFTSEVATTAYIRYGLDGKLTTTTPVTASATSHTIALDPSLLIPGETYSYVIYSTNAQGVTSETPVQTIKTKGLPVSFVIFDKNHEPLRNKTITMHSTPQTAKTNDKGVVVFGSVSPGEHSIIYTAGKKSYTQSVTIASNVTTQGDTQSATQQNFSVVYGFEQPSSHATLIIWLSAIVLVVGLIVALERTGRLGFALQFKDKPFVPQANTVIGADHTSARPVVFGSSPKEPDVAVQNGLDAIPDPSAPAPGSTVTPKVGDADSTKNEDS